jgi:hypothetical protein
MAPGYGNQGWPGHLDVMAVEDRHASANESSTAWCVNPGQIGLMVRRGMVLCPFGKRTLSDAVTTLRNFAQQTFENIEPRRKLSTFRGKHSKFCGQHKVPTVAARR